MRGRRGEALLIAREEFRRQMRRTGYRFFTLLVPALLLIALVIVPVVRGITDKRSGEVEKIGFFDPLGILTRAENNIGVARYGSRRAGLDALLSKEVEALFVIDPAYMETGRVEWYRTGGSRFSSGEAGDRFRTLLATSLVADRVAPAVLVRVNGPANYERFRLGEDGAPLADTTSDAEEAANFFVPFIFAILLMVSIFTGSGYLLQNVAEEKESRMIEMIVTSVSPFSIMAGKVAALGGAGLIQVAVRFISGILIGPRILSQIPDVGDLPLDPGVIASALAFFLAGYLLFAVLMAGIGAATSSVREGTQFSAIIGLPAVIVLYSSRIIVDTPNGAYARALSYVPFTAPTAMMLRLGAGSVPVVDIIGSLIVTLLAGVALLWLSARVFRAGLLLYGQRMSPAAIWRAIRQAG